MKKISRVSVIAVDCTENIKQTVRVLKNCKDPTIFENFISNGCHQEIDLKFMKKDW